MSWTICFPVAKDRVTVDGNRWICITIPIYYIPRLIVKPDPPPFFNHPDFDKEKVLQMETLATIDELAGKLPAELSRDIQHSVAAHMKSFAEKLGGSAEVSRSQQRA